MQCGRCAPLLRMELLLFFGLKKQTECLQNIGPILWRDNSDDHSIYKPPLTKPQNVYMVGLFVKIKVL